VWVFLDCCRSGGIIDALLRALPYVVGTTTSTRDGRGYDLSVTQSGAWTNEFLLQGLVVTAKKENGGGDLCRIFRSAHDRYARKLRLEVDRPWFFGRIGPRTYNTERMRTPDATQSLPVGTFRVDDWL
jgi:hypothetical protein